MCGHYRIRCWSAGVRDACCVPPCCTASTSTNLKFDETPHRYCSVRPTDKVWISVV